MNDANLKPDMQSGSNRSGRAVKDGKRSGDFNIYSLLWTLLLHLSVIVLLLFIYMRAPQVKAESGVPVMLGDMGNLYTDYDFIEINRLPTPTGTAIPTPSVPDAETAITQDYEETVVLEPTEEQESVADYERRAQEEAQSLMADVFGTSRTMQSTVQEQSPDDASGIPGDPRGNSAQGLTVGAGSYGSWDLSGRQIIGELSRPIYNIQEEGRVVVTITVSPEGNVIKTQINNRTNTTNLQLRKAAEEAAARTRFNMVGGVNNQTGTIIYYFKLR